MVEPSSSTSGPSGDQLTGRLLVGRYRLVRPIASGGMAQVWEASDQTLTRRVAIKILHPHLAADDSFVQRFRGEAVAAARLAHPSIVSVYDTFSTDGIEAIVMELVVGTTMRADLDQHGPMRLEAVLAIGTQVADALGAAHAAGLVHRDVKPANILLSADGRVLVADFGIAKAAEGADLTTAGSMVGTAKYLAPEQVEGRPIDGRADLYSLGVVLYEALTGVPPFVADTDAGTALARLHQQPVPPRRRRPEIPVAVEAVVMQALNRRADERFATAAAMRRALLGAGADPRQAPVAAEAAAGAASPQPISAPSGPPAAPPARPPAPPAPPATPAPAPTPIASAPAPRRSRRWMAVVVVMALAGLAAFFAVNGGGTPAAAAEIPIDDATSFDPQGDNATEREDLVDAAIDEDADSAWRSERYSDPEAMADKDGVGVAITLARVAQIERVDVVSPEAGWSAEIYVATGDGLDSLDDWGPAQASVAAADTGTTRFTLEGVRGDRVLIWFTRTSDDGTASVSDVVVTGR